MPQYRKTRKIRKAKKHQKGGAGVFSLFTKPTPKLPHESYKSSVNRVMTFLYSRIHSIPPTQTLLTKDQKEELRSVLIKYKEGNSYREDDFAREILGFKNGNELNDAIRKVEAPGTPIIDIVSNTPAIAESHAGGFSRIIPVIFSNEKTINYRQNWERNICAFDPHVNQNRPIVSLQEKRCIAILAGKSEMETLLLEYQLVYGDNATIESGFPYLIVKPEFMPQMNNKSFPYTRIHANKLMATTYVLDAFKENGVIEIQPDLANVISQEYKAFWNSLGYVQTRQYSNLSGLNLFGDRFLLLDTAISNPFLHISQIPPTAHVYGFDPQTSVQLRKQYPALWNTWISDPNLEFFMKLSNSEQFLIAILQYIQLIKKLKVDATSALNVYEVDLTKKENQESFIKDTEFDKQEDYRKIFKRI